MLRKKLRVGVKSFKYIVALLLESHAFQFWKHQNVQQKYISIDKQVAIFPYFVSRNYLYHDIADIFGVGGANTVCKILERVSSSPLEFKSVYNKGHTDVSKQEMLENANHYGFINCIGIIDGLVNQITSFDKDELQENVFMTWYPW